MSGELEEARDGGEDRFPSHRTKGVDTLLGDPKRAIVRLSVPMIIAMSIQTVYNVVDALWVSGLGPDALAAVGLFFPFFFILIAISTGIGVGASAALSRRIGARDKDGSDNVAIHSLLMMMGVSVVMVAVFVPLTSWMFAAIGATGTVLDMTVSYAHIMFAAAPILFFINWATSILRGEGDVNRAMWAMAIGAGLNIAMDPVFIYTLGLGVAGAAWASAISISVSTVPIAYWMFIKRDTYVTMRRCCFAYSRWIIRDVLKVGVPATIMQLAMSISMLFLNIIIIGIAGTDGVAVFTTGWRVVMIAILPLIGIATAVVSVSGAAFGARQYGKIDIALNYSIKVGVAVELVISTVTFLMAGPIAAVFSTGEGGERIKDDLEHMLRVVSIHYPVVAMGMFSSSMFQGTGKGMNALAVTILRTVVLTLLFALALTRLTDLGLRGVWWGLVLGNAIGALVAFAWAKVYIARLNGGPVTNGQVALVPD